MFVFYILFPSISKEGDDYEDPLISKLEKNYQLEENDELQQTPSRAFVLCNCKKTFVNEKINKNDLHTCAMFNSVYGTGTDCKFACIGLGDCVKVCPQQAIYIENRTAQISSLCIGCGKCTTVCPLNIIKLIPIDQKQIIKCNNCSDENMTTCDCKQKEEKVVWNDKKDFKIWSYCYKIIKVIYKKIF